MDSIIKVRLDKFLKETRVIPRRSVAKDVIDNGNILLNEKIAKPCTNVNDGDIIKIYIRGIELVIKAKVEPKGKKIFVSAELLERNVSDITKC